MSFMILKVTDAAPWFTWTASLGLNVLCELDCKEQFNKVRPEWITDHMNNASSRLGARKRWRGTTLMWCVHYDHKKLDRAGQASGQGFCCIAHDTLLDQVSFDLMRNNYCAAAGSARVLRGCIPMGGPFSSQSADLHCVWGRTEQKHVS